MSFQEQPAVDDEQQHLAAVFQEASLEAIDRAMHRDIYLVRITTLLGLFSSTKTSFINMYFIINFM
jgi:hypothetical protein